MNKKTTNIENFGKRIRKLLLFFPMYVLLRNCRVHIPDPWRYPAPAKIDTGVGYIPTNRPAKTKARVAPETQPTTGFFHGCRALIVTFHPGRPPPAQRWGTKEKYNSIYLVIMVKKSFANRWLLVCLYNGPSLRPTTVSMANDIEMIKMREE